MKVVRTLLVAVTALLSLTVATAGAQTSNSSPCVPGSGTSNYPPRDCALAADRTNVPAGGTVRLTGNCPSGAASVNFRLNPGNVDLGSATPGGDGSYSRTVTIPSGTRPGNYEIVATCSAVQGVVVTRSVALTVVAAAADARAGTLPRTGTGLTLPLAISSILLIGAGGVAVLASRRRQA